MNHIHTLYYAALAADDAFQKACIAEHGPAVGRWAKHTRPETIKAYNAKVEADAKLRDAMLNKVQS